MHQVDVVGNSPGVRRELAEGIGSLPGWRKGVYQKKIETHRKIIEGSQKLTGIDGPRSCLGIGLGFDDAMGPRLEFARRFAEGIGKLAGNMPGDRQKKTRRLITRIPEAVELTRVRS
ncbi:hypothetical protein BHE74_00027656 [Ensete ventricosum]|nr:hypothetical protein BHE74_00027656 [Ensete ventricosum]RZR87873.1 hypothetical protein BHM03_00015344 [Ensete ventricosum]